MEVYKKVIASCFTDSQIPILKQALRTGVPVYLYGHGLGKSLLAETFRNAGYNVSEPGDRLDALGPMDMVDMDGMVAFCVRNAPKERISGVFDTLLKCPDEIAEWVNQ